MKFINVNQYLTQEKGKKNEDRFSFIVKKNTKQ